MVAHLQDNQAISLKQEFPTSAETANTALLLQYRSVNAVPGWEQYTTLMFNVAAFAGQPRTNFVDAQYEAWKALTAP